MTSPDIARLTESLRQLQAEYRDPAISEELVREALQQSGLMLIETRPQP